MEALLFLIAVGVAGAAVRQASQPRLADSPDTSAPRRDIQADTAAGTDSYEARRSQLRTGKQHLCELDLLGTPAAIAWSDNDPEVGVVCIRAFRKGAPAAQVWDRFGYDRQGKRWTGATPKGAAAEIRKELKQLGLL